MEVQMNSKMSAFLLLPLTLAFALGGCDKQPTAVTPHELTTGDSCSLDGMSLLDFPGPKAQIHYASGEPDLFCDTAEMFSIYLQPEQQKRVTGIFTQDMAKTSWEEPRNNWVLHNKKMLTHLRNNLAARCIALMRSPWKWWIYPVV
jgi:copper chaperone NosL